ncbi:MAG TPA: Wzz/FepE/Etk N-terminal domain-containing protein, partial [Gemmatimonadaceae bacterium]
MTAADGPAPVSVRELTRRIARRRWLVLGIAAIVFVAVAVYTFAVTPRYASQARLRIESQTPGGSSAISAIADQASSTLPGGGGGAASSLLGLGRDELETEIGVLRSDRIADAMIDSLALGTRMTTPNVPRSTVLTARVVDPAVDADGKLTLTRTGDGHYRVERKKLDDVSNLPTVMTPGVPIQVGGTVVTLLPRLIGAGPSKIVIKFLPRYEVYKLLQKRLDIARQEGGSRLVEVSFEDPDRLLAAQVVNTLIGEYVAYSTRTERYQDTTTVAELRFQVDSTARKLSEAETALRDYQESSKLVAPTEQATEQLKRMGLISAHIDAISTERNALAKMLAVIQQKSRGGTDATAYRQLATFPTLISNRAIQDLLQSLLDLENKRAELG